MKLAHALNIKATAVTPTAILQYSGDNPTFIRTIADTRQTQENGSIASSMIRCCPLWKRIIVRSMAPMKASPQNVQVTP